MRTEFKREVKRMWGEMKEREEEVKRDLERIKKEVRIKEKEWEEERKFF